VKPLVVRAAGGLLLRRGPAGPELAVIHRPVHRDWSLPKGKLERGEGWRAAALREVREETGCEATADGLAGATLYLAGGRPKVVLYFRMAVVREAPFAPGREVDALLWLAPREALERLDHASERRLVARLARRLAGAADAPGRAP
jgi:8-oxo-dGTP diphosphatase